MKFFKKKIIFFTSIHGRYSSETMLSSSYKMPAINIYK